MGSDSSSATTTSTNNLAVDRSATLGTGTQILDSIVIDPSDTVMVEAMKKVEAAFDVLTSNSTLQLEDMLDLGKQILGYADSAQIALEGFAYAQLKAGVDMLESARDQGKYVLTLTADVADKSLEIVEGVSERNDDRLDDALSIIADVQTGDYQDTLVTVATTLTIFALGALYILNRRN